MTLKEIIQNPYLILRLTIRDLQKANRKLYPAKLHLKKGIDWLIRAQKITEDGGVSSGYSLLYGWGSSYPETSGYLIRTLMDYSDLTNNKEYLDICKDIAEWECSIQLKNGGFPGDVISKRKKAVTFNTGQVILGLTRAYKEFGNEKFLKCAIKAGNLLVRTQEKDGNWIKNCFNNLSHSYNVRTAWALLELYLATDIKKFQESAIKNLDWSLKQKNENYWLFKNSFKTNKAPLLHTIAYSIRGFLEAGIILDYEKYKDFALNTSLKLLNCYESNHFLPARFNSNWQSNDFYTCLTGDAQLSIIWLKLSQMYNDKKFLINAMKLNNYLKLQQIMDHRLKDIDGAIKGSSPIWGLYNMFNFPNWATKFYCDALMLEIKIRSGKS